MTHTITRDPGPENMNWQDLWHQADAQIRREIWGYYMASRDWAVRRRQALDRTDGHCERCGRAEPLQAHHRTYVRRFQEDPLDLQALCADCHVYLTGRSDLDPRRGV
jgi:5-methylcytosine-specific restriction endonuclease McrA